MNLINSLIEQKYLKTDRIIEAFKRIKRKDFMPEDLKDSAELNTALPIGYGQTISQPLVVAFMLELLEPKPGDKILDVGAGSGWTSGLLAEIVGKKGKVIAIELIPELVEFGKKNVSKYNFIKKGRVQFICADGQKGYEKEAPFDKILCSAAIKSFKNKGKDNLPISWKKQLKTEGKIVTPVDSSIWLFSKNSEGKFDEKEYPGFAFVPLIKK